MTRVLLVDDDHDVLGANARFLRVSGHETVVATTADAALERLATHEIEVAVTDLRLPGTDGLGFARAARECRPFLPILFFSGFARVPDVVAAMRLGAADFLEKPVEPELMLAAVERLADGAAGAVERRAFLPADEGVPLRSRVRAYERHVIEATLRRHDGRVADVLEALSVSRRTLNDKMARLGIRRAELRDD